MKVLLIQTVAILAILFAIPTMVLSQTSRQVDDKNASSHWDKFEDPENTSLFLLNDLKHSSSKDIVHFAATSDQHYNIGNYEVPPYDDDTIDDWMYHEGLPEFDFVFASIGDFITDTGSNISHRWNLVSEHNLDHHKVPYFWVFGNHDITNYKDMIDGNPVRSEDIGRSISGLNENNYAFLYNNVLFICAAQTNNLYHLSNFQKCWIEYLLERYHDKITIIFAHQAIYQTTGRFNVRATSWTSNDYKIHNDISWWKLLFDSNPQIKLYIHGHNEKGHNTVFFDGHPESWDDNCIFVLVPSNGKSYTRQYGWSYVFSISDSFIHIRLWNSETHLYDQNVNAGVPYLHSNMTNNVTDTGFEWLSIPKQVIDGQNWTWANHIVAESYLIELVGNDQTELIDNPDLDGCHEGAEGGSWMRGYWYGVRGDRKANNIFTGERDGYISIDGGNILELAASGANLDGGQAYIEGKVPYNTAIAVPAKEYIFSCQLKTTEDTGTVDFLISIPKVKDIDNLVWDKHTIRSNILVNSQCNIFSQVFSIPDNKTMWFIQPHIQFSEGATFILESWSLKMVGDSEFTENFRANLNGKTYKYSGILNKNEFALFPVRNTLIDNQLNFSTSIDGNKVGMLRLLYKNPKLWSDDVSIGIKSESQDKVYLKDVSPFNARTTIMSFDKSDYGILGAGFNRESVRGKAVYLNDKNDDSLDGFYTVSKNVEQVYTRHGNVNSANGSSQNVLLINKSPGNDFRSLVTLSNHPLLFTLEPSSFGPNPADFVLYLWPGEPRLENITTQPFNIGQACFPMPLSSHSPLAPPYTVANTFGFNNILGYPLLNNQNFTPWSFSLGCGFPQGTVCTFQGLLFDYGSSSPLGVSLTNAIVLKAAPSNIFHRRGNVDSNCGIPVDVLFVNGNTGNDERLLFISTGEKVDLTIFNPPAGPIPAYFALYWVWWEPDVNDLQDHPFNIGISCMPMPLSNLANGNPAFPPPLTLANTMGHNWLLGNPRIQGLPPAPCSIFDVPQLPPGTYALQGYILDNGSSSPYGVSLTNAIVLKVQ